MKTSYLSHLMKTTIWPNFTSHFRNPVTAASYYADLTEIVEFSKKDFLVLETKDAEQYFGFLQKKLDQNAMKASTIAKKFRELHSLAAFISENQNVYGLEGYQDPFLPFMNEIAKQERYAKTIPIEHIDALLRAAETDLMAYAILVLLHRVGLSSTEIINLRTKDFSAYDNGVYVAVTGKTEPRFVPQDAFIIMESYLKVREPKEYLFYNQRGNKLNAMYISRLMKKYTLKAGIPSYSAETIRNTCGSILFSYGAKPEQIAKQMGISTMQIQRYHNLSYRENLMREANQLVKIEVKPPKI